MTTGDNSTKIILSSPEDWNSWIRNVQRIAESGGIKCWVYLDPTTTVVPIPELLDEPELPTVDENASEAVIDRALKQYQMQLENYRIKNTKYEKINKAISEVLKYILSSINRNCEKFISTTSITAPQVLADLRKRLAPTDRARELTVVARYNCVKQPYKSNQDIYEWLNEWELIYTEAKTLNLPDVDRNRAAFDFSTALMNHSSSWATSTLLEITKKLKNQPEETIDVYDLIEDFRNYTRLTHASTTSTSSTSFATYKDGNKDKKEGERTCLCGKKHLYEKCYYLYSDNRPRNWKPIDADIEYFKKFWGRQSTKRRNWFVRRHEGTKELLKLANLSWDPAWKETLTNPSESGKEKDKDLGAFLTKQSPTYNNASILHKWLIDSGSDTHVTNSLHNFVLEEFGKPSDMISAGRDRFQIEAFGTITMLINTPTGPGQITLKRVAYIPGFLTNLVSLALLSKKGVHWNTEHPDVLTKEGIAFITLKQTGDHWTLDPIIPSQHASFATKNHTKSICRKVTTTELHDLLGHPSLEALQHLESATTDIIIDKTISTPSFSTCKVCNLSKAQQIISRNPRKEMPENGHVGDRLAWDLFEMDEAYNNTRYISHFWCTTHKIQWVYVLTRKTEMIDIMDTQFSLIQTQFGSKVRFIRLDGETTLGGDFKRITDKRGIIVERTPPDTPAQNGAAENAGKMLMVRARALLLSANLPQNLWPEAIKTAGYLENRTPKRALQWKTPFESATGNKPSLAHLHPYGCLAYVLNKQIPRRAKMQPRAKLGYLVGYDSTNIFRIWLPSINRVIRSRDVKFDETRYYRPEDVDIGFLIKDQLRDTAAIHEKRAEEIEISNLLSEESDESIGDIIVVEGPWNLQHNRLNERPTNESSSNKTDDGIPTNEGVPQTNPQLPTPRATLSPEALTRQSTGDVPIPSLPESELSSSPSSSLSQHDIITTTSSHNTAPLAEQIRADIDVSHIIQGSRRSQRKEHHAAALSSLPQLSSYFAAFAIGRSKLRTPRLHQNDLPPPPRFYHELVQHPYAREFRKACEDEINALKERKTFEYIDISTRGQKPLPLLWVFTYKFDQDGYLIKFKARICARGDLQSTEEETYAATLTSQIFRAMMAIAAAFDLEIRQFDVSNAFLHATLRQPIICKCPDGFEVPGKVISVNQALYGFRESPAYWYEDLTYTLTDFGLDPVPGAPCVFTNSWLTVLFYVDDIIAICKKADLLRLTLFENTLKSAYTIKSLGDIQFFLGIRVLRDRQNHRLWLCQDNYISKISTRFNIKPNPQASSPLPTTALTKNPAIATPQQVFGYQQRVGSINYAAVVTRADIAKASSILSEFLRNPSATHINAAVHTLQYLENTKFYAIMFDGKKATTTRNFQIWSDASHADDIDTRVSSMGYCLILFGGLIHFKSTKLKSVTTSSTHSEILALSVTARELMWWIRFFKNVGLNLEEKASIFCDNRQTIRLLQHSTPRLVTKLRHVDIHSCWLRQEVQAGRLQVEWVPTTEMVADGFTKPLPPQKHTHFINLLGMVDIRSQVQE